MLMYHLRIACLITAIGFSSLSGAVWAQSVEVDTTSLIRRLESIEARLSVAEARKSSGVVNIGGASDYSTNTIQARLDDLETESSQLRGVNDRSQVAIERLAKRFDEFTKDFDMRMGDMEARIEALDKVAVPAAATQTPATEAVAEAVKPVASASIPADMTATDHYNKAYAYLTATDYKNSQLWFEEFLKRHPEDALADNAYYWLGEVYLVQNNPNAAVQKFRDGLKAFPKGTKASANLYKMGVALEQLKQPKLAKAAWSKLIKEFPSAPEAAKAKDKMAILKD
jgi:tol-pal system protein YbgF